MTNYSLSPTQLMGARAIAAIPYIRPVVSAFSLGYSAGNLINKYTPVQSWISRMY